MTKTEVLSGLVSPHFDSFPQENVLDCNGWKDHRKTINMREDRQFKRWSVSIPCVVVWKNEVVKAQITNLSPNGAFVNQTNLIPAEGTQVVVGFQVGQEEMRFTAKVNSKVVHSRWEITEDDQTVSFGLEFSGTQKEIESNLKSLVGTLDSVEGTEDLSEA